MDNVILLSDGLFRVIQPFASLSYSPEPDRPATPPRGLRSGSHIPRSRDDRRWHAPWTISKLLVPKASPSETSLFLTRPSYVPDLIESWFTLGVALNTQPNITAREQEIMIHALLSIYESPYVEYVHRARARSVGLSDEQIDIMLAGDELKDFTEVESVVFRLSREISASRRPVGRGTFDAAQQVLGTSKVAALTHTVAGFVYVAILANIGDGTVPDS